MSPKHLRCGARVAAAVLDTAALGVGAYFTVSDRQLRVSDLMLGLIFAAIVTGTWLLVEVVVGGFEHWERVTQARYDQLATVQADAGLIVAHTISALADDGHQAEVVSLRR